MGTSRLSTSDESAGVIHLLFLVSAPTTSLGTPLIGIPKGEVPWDVLDSSPGRYGGGTGVFQKSSFQIITLTNKGNKFIIRIKRHTSTIMSPVPAKTLGRFSTQFCLKHTQDNLYAYTKCQKRKTYRSSGDRCH